MKSRFLSCVLVLTMLCALVPPVATAAEDPDVLFETVFSGSVLPDGWTATSGWTMHPEEQAIFSNTKDSWLISPRLILPENAVLEYGWKNLETGGNCDVYISTTGTDREDFRLTRNANSLLSFGDVNHSAIRLSGYSGPVYLAFVTYPSSPPSLNLYSVTVHTWESAPAPVATLESVARSSPSEVTVTLQTSQRCYLKYCLTAPGEAPPDGWDKLVNENYRQKIIILKSLPYSAYDLHLTFENAIGKRYTTCVSIPVCLPTLPYLPKKRGCTDIWRHTSGFAIEMVPYDKTLVALYREDDWDVHVGDTLLVPGRDYTLGSNFVNLNNSYLCSFGEEIHEFRFVFSDNTVKYFLLFSLSSKPLFSGASVGYVSTFDTPGGPEFKTNTTHDFVIRLSPQDLAELGYRVLRQVQFAPTFYSSPSGPSCSLKIWQGGNCDEILPDLENLITFQPGGQITPGTLVYTQPIGNMTSGQINTVTLNTPLTVDPNKELWIGIHVNQSSESSSFNLMQDITKPANPGWGDLHCMNGYWYSEVKEYYHEDNSVRNHYIRGIFEGGIPNTLTGAQVRTRGNPGLRFLSELPLPSADVEEYGTILAPYSASWNTETFVIGGDSVVKVPAKRLYEKTDTKVQFTAVITDIAPENYTREYAARAYAILKDGSVVYADEFTTRSLFEVAQAALQDTSVTWSESERTYLQEIVNP